MEDNMKICPYCGEEILAVAKKCKYCGEWLENKEAASSTEELAKVTEVHQESTDTQVTEDEENKQKDEANEFLQGITFWLLVAAVVGSFANTAYEYGYNLIGFSDVHYSGIRWLICEALVLTGKIPLYIGNALYVMGACGLFVMLYIVLKSIGITCRNVTSGIALGTGIIIILGSMDGLIREESDSVTLGLVILLAVIMMVVCLVLLGYKAIEGKVTVAEEIDTSSLKSLGVMCCVYAVAATVGVVLGMADVSAEGLEFFAYVALAIEVVTAWRIVVCVIDFSEYTSKNGMDEFKKMIIPYIALAILAGGISYYTETHQADEMEKIIQNIDEEMPDESEERDSTYNDNDY